MAQVPHPTKRHPPAGRCIYCGSDGDGKALTEEHVVPFSLGGNEVIPEASCNACSVITAKLEGYIGRSVFWALRAALGIQTRRPKDRPQELPIFYRVGESLKEMLVAITKHSADFSLPFLPPPGLLLNQEPSNSWGKVDLGTWSRKPDLAEHEDAAAGWRLFVKTDPMKICRFVAKVAHCDAVASYGLGSFNPLLTDLILGKDNRAPFLIGAIPGRDLPCLQAGHYQTFRTFRVGMQRYLVYRLRLFANIGKAFGTPHFLAVVGTIPQNDGFAGLVVQDSFDALAKELLAVGR